MAMELDSNEHGREMSIASTATLAHEDGRHPRGRSHAFERSFVHGDDGGLNENRMEIDSQLTRANQSTVEKDGTFVIATDFGTTFSSIAFARRVGVGRPEIGEITNYPRDILINRRAALQVPTETWYLDSSQVEEPSEDDDPMDLLLGNGSDSDDQLDGAGDLDDDKEDDVADNDEERDGDDDIDRPQAAPKPSHDELSNLLWGYEVAPRALEADTERQHYNRIARSKLLLDQSDHTKTIRAELGPLLRRLKQNKMIQKDDDIITHFLVKLFRHAKSQLVEEHGLSDSTPVEHVLCVPVLWKSSTLRRMEHAINAAIQRSGLGSSDNLFFVSEPEAAAAYVIETNRGQVSSGQKFLILDAGGGTVDATTYKVTKDHPLRLSEQLTESTGCLHGSSYLNEGFRQHLRDRLQGEEPNIEIHGQTIEGLIEAHCERFESPYKRTIDFTSRFSPITFSFPGLQQDAQRRFLRNNISLNQNDFVAIFIPHLHAIAELMKQQINEAMNNGHEIEKVILIGGFSASPALRKYLEARLKELARSMGHRIQLVSDLVKGEHETAVARGAVLRAWNKEEGPQRIAQSSYGFGIWEEHNTLEHEEHKGIRPKYDRLDGRYYVDASLIWLVKKGDHVNYHQEYTMPVYRAFAATRKAFKCTEILYVSDECTKSHYRLTHAENKNKAHEAGVVLVDWTQTVRDGRIPISQPEHGIGRPHYKIDYELAMIIDGRNLRFEARWPIGGKAVGKGGQISIAAAFKTGTN